jgi:hypothetical protein
MDQVRPHVCSWHPTTLPKIGRPILSNPIRWRPARRPRTEARPRRTDVSRVKKGIDKPRPVTEADVSPKGLVALIDEDNANHRATSRRPSSNKTAPDVKTKVLTRRSPRVGLCAAGVMSDGLMHNVASVQLGHDCPSWTLTCAHDRATRTAAGIRSINMVRKRSNFAK